jgi:transcriptional regulator GlxA family with amidase domain
MIIDQALRAEKPQPGIPVDLATRDDVIRKALLQMRQHIETPLTVDEIARRVGVSRRSLERRFDGTLGKPPSDCYLSMRLEQAALLLGRTDQTVAAIAAATGFCDSSHFARLFRQHRGITPAKARLAPGEHRPEPAPAPITPMRPHRL